MEEFSKRETPHRERNEPLELHVKIAGITQASESCLDESTAKAARPSLGKVCATAYCDTWQRKDLSWKFAQVSKPYQSGPPLPPFWLG